MEHKAITGCAAHSAYNRTDYISWMVCLHKKTPQINKKAFLPKNNFPLSRFWNIGLHLFKVEWNFDCSATEHPSPQISITANNQSIKPQNRLKPSKKVLFPLVARPKNVVSGSTPLYTTGWGHHRAPEKKTWSKWKDLQPQPQPVPPDVSEHLRFAFAHPLTVGKAAKIILTFNSFSAFVCFFQDNTWTAMLTPLPSRNPAAAGRSNSRETQLATGCWT